MKKTEEKEYIEAKKREEKEEMEEKEKTEEEKKIAGEAKTEEPKIRCLMTKLNIDPREKTDCTVKQYGSVSSATDPRDLILQAVKPLKGQDLSITAF